jgi:N6-L-threonylcarbamoyladenine synthase
MSDEKTLKWLGGTLDDAAGECFDKTARLLGLPYPGGPAIAAEAAKYSSSERSESRSNLNKDSSRLRSNNIHLPRPMLKDDSLNFSFSGLKTAVLREYNKMKSSQQFNNLTMQQFSFEIQESITDVLVAKTLKAAEIYHAKSIIVTGGVAANKRLSEKFFLAIKQFNNRTIGLFIPPPHLCVDSASYIAAAAYFRGHPQPWQTIEARPDLPLEI